MRPMPRCSPTGVLSLSDGRGIGRGATNANLVAWHSEVEPSR